MKRAFLAAAMACTLAGCASSADPSQATLRKERIESWQKLCEGRGFTRGTSDFHDCVMGYDQEAANPPIK
jgi:hypothetical protein